MLKLTVPRSTLTAALTITARVASSGSHIMAAQGVCITIGADSTATVAATDFDTSIEFPLTGVTATEAGRLVLPARLLLEIVKACAGETVTIEGAADNSSAQVTSGRSAFTLNGYPVKDFPPLPQADGGPVAQLPVGPFIQAVDQVAGTVSKDETRPVLKGIHMVANEDGLRAEATDSYRLSVAKSTLDGEANGSLEALFPSVALQELARLAKTAKDTSIKLALGQNSMIFTLDQTILSTRLISGTFPNTKALIPEETTHSIHINALELHGAVSRAALLCKQNEPLVLAFSKAGLEVSANAREIGSASELIDDVDWTAGAEPLTVGFNPLFLRDALARYGDGEITLGLNTELRPLLLSDASGSLQQILMPIRLTNN